VAGNVSGQFPDAGDLSVGQTFPPILEIGAAVQLDGMGLAPGELDRVVLTARHSDMVLNAGGEGQP